MTPGPARFPGAPAILVAFGLIAVLIGWDLLSDYGEGVRMTHVVVELALLLLASTMFGVVLRQMLLERRQALRLNRRLDSATIEARQWRERYQSTLRGLGGAIQAQFEAWKLSPAEAEIGLLLLKGLSLKEIADARDTAERTVREQARAIYRKAGLGGRSELSAFFLEDLLLPHPAAMPGEDG